VASVRSLVWYEVSFLRGGDDMLLGLVEVFTVGVVSPLGCEGGGLLRLPPAI
jgi:hypothetical protein